ncbi:MAG: 5-methyltetrahydropteroyltriglutamate--homocysteine S-methyltransferase [Rhodospirillaceae bacterium]|nr:5-methyltetrahydropteroyltriglutamate--homocysteine S-methyltransferase [Rhodospirillaceae bacterium]
MSRTPLTPPFRADVVGSYLRPASLHEARRRFAAGAITQEELTAIEDKAITELVARQKAAGLKAITDGEFRRSWWHLDFMWGLGGVEKAVLGHGYRFADMETRAETARLTGRISGENHPFLDHFRFLLRLADETVVPRLTVPAPAQFFKELCRPENLDSTTAVYPSRDDLLADIASAYRVFIRELHALGCRNLQLDDCTWGMMVDPRYTNAGVAAKGETGCGCDPESATVITGSVAELAEILVALNNEAIAGAPADLALTTHVCRGNYRSHWAAQGGYAPIAPYLFSRENVSAYYLEFDTDRAGDFSPLTQVSGDKKVVLGLVSSKIGALENKDAVVARVREASLYLPLDRLCVSTQCGFASTEEGNSLTEDEQWAKIALVCAVAKEVWGSEG